MLFRKITLSVCLAFNTFALGSSSNVYQKDEIQHLLSLPNELKEKYSIELNLIESNIRTNDGVLIFKEPIRYNFEQDSILSGMCFVIKGTIPIKGVLPFNGLGNYPGPSYTAEKNLDIIDKLLEAGATIVGLGKGPPFSARSITNPVGEPPIKSRINPKYSSGGSSGGVGANNLYGIGTDIAGSGRIPAAYNKRFTLFGVHRSQQRKSYGLFYTPMTDSIDDLWRIYLALEGKSIKSLRPLEQPKNKKIAIVEKLPTTADTFSVHPSRVKSLEDTIEVLKNSGHTIVKINVDTLKAFQNEHDESKRMIRNFVQRFTMEIAKNLNSLIEKYGKPQPQQLDEMSWFLYNLGSLLLENEEEILQKTHQDYMVVREHTKAFKRELGFDVIVTPTILAEWAKPDDFSIPEAVRAHIEKASLAKNSSELLEIAVDLYQRELNLCNTLWGNVHDGDLPIVAIPGKKDAWNMYHSYQLIGLNGKDMENIFELLSLAKQLSDKLSQEGINEEK